MLKTKVLKGEPAEPEGVEEEELYTAEEAGEYLQYHPEYVRLLARNGELKGLKLGRRGRGGSWRFAKEDLDDIKVRLYDPLEVNEG